MPKIFLSFEAENGAELRAQIYRFLDISTARPSEPAASPEMAKDAETLSDKEWDAKYGQTPEFPPESPNPPAPGGKPNGGGDSASSAPPSSEPKTAAPRKSSKKSAPAPAPEPEPDAEPPSLAVLRDAIVEAFKRQEPSGIRDAAAALREKAGYATITGMPDTPEIRALLWNFVREQGLKIEVV